MRKKNMLSDIPQEVPTIDHSLPPEWIFEGSENKILEWKAKFDEFVEDYAVSKTHNKVITEKMKWSIYNHCKYGLEIEHRNLKYWVQFRRITIISCDQLGLENVLVMPLTKYNNAPGRDRAEIHLKDGVLSLVSEEPTLEFFDNFRLIPTCEEMFKLLYYSHCVAESHPAAKVMFGNIRRKYLYLPRNIVDKFVEMCPWCCTSVPEAPALAPSVSVDNGDVVNLAGIQVCVGG